METTEPTPSAPIRVFLLDDHEIVRRGVRELIESEPDLIVVGEAGTAADAIARIPPTRPDVAVLDVQLDDGSGVEVCRDVRSRHPEIGCLMLTSFADDEALLDSVVAGAQGYVLKQVRGADLVESIRAIAAGRTLIPPDVVLQVRERLRTGSVVDERLAALSGQERKILDLLADGLTNREIGERLYLSEKTVKNYMSNVLMKLGMHRRTEAAVFAARARPRDRRPPTST
ncbi:MAG: response regulator transcription factor [Acidimicrobiales bacterium]